MRRPHIRSWLSYANVTATLALVIATSAGGAYAAATIGSADIKGDAVKSRHIDNGSVSRSDLKDGAVGQQKLASNVAAASAYGTIWWTGTSVTGARNLTTANVVHPETGVYCIVGLSFEPSMALVSSTYEPNASHHDIEVYGLGGNWGNTDPCPSESQIQIRVYAPGTTTEQNGNFNIAIY